MQQGAQAQWRAILVVARAGASEAREREGERAGGEMAVVQEAVKRHGGGSVVRQSAMAMECSGDHDALPCGWH